MAPPLDPRGHGRTARLRTNSKPRQSPLRARQCAADGEPVVIAGREPCGYWSARPPPPAAPVSASVFPVAAVVRAGAAILGVAGLPALFASASCSRHEASAG